MLTARHQKSHQGSLKGLLTWHPSGFVTKMVIFWAANFLIDHGTFFWCFPKSFRQPTFGVRGNVVYPEDIWNGGPMPESKQIATSVISSLISCRVISDVMKVRSQCLIIFRTIGFMGLLSESNYIHLPGHRHQRWSLVQGEAKPQKTISQYFRLVKDHDSDNKLPGLPNYEQY